MPTQRKIDTVADLKGRLEKATMIVSTEYRGLRVKEMQDLRRKLREGGLDVRVVKNTLLKRAADELGEPDIVRISRGRRRWRSPTAM
jgi:large subunit ribosomal protein L10